MILGMRLNNITYGQIDKWNFEPATAQRRSPHGNNSHYKSLDTSSVGFLDQVQGELSLVLYTIVDALYSARTNDNYSDRFDDVLWLTESSRDRAKDKSLQFYCELIGVSFKRLQRVIIELLCDSSLVDQNARVNITYRSYDNSRKVGVKA